MVKDAKAAGFDPLGNIMSVCREVYADKILRFHAWFPVFNDPYSAQIQGVKGKAKFVLSDNDLVAVTLDGMQLPNDVDYTSHLFAEPGNASVRTQQLGILKDILRNYPNLYGINLDYIRYPEQESVKDVSKPGDYPTCILDPRADGLSNDECRENQSPNVAKKVIWTVNPDAVSAFVKMVKDTFSTKFISADLFPTPSSRYSLGQEGALNNIDVAMLMAYTKFGGHPISIRDVLTRFYFTHPTGRVVTILRGWKIGEDGEGLISDLSKDIQDAKDWTANGYVVFTYDSLLNDTGSSSLLSIKKRLVF